MPVVKKKPIKGKKTTTKDYSDVVYSQVVVEVCAGPKAMTAARARELLGWEAEEGTAFGSNYLLKDEHGTKVRCQHNRSNRLLNMSLAKCWESEILNGRWQLNGETLIVDRFGTIISAQHRLIALVLAAQLWAKEPERFPFWTSEPTIDCILVCGISELDAVVNTVDTGRPRSLADVIYRSPYFKGLPKRDRRVCSKAASYAVDRVRRRTGANVHVIGNKISHADHLDFMARHNRLLECIKHIYEEDGTEKRIKPLIGIGNAAGLMYMMASSSTDPKDYAKSYPPSETALCWDMWDKASSFWVELAAGSDALKAVRTMRSKYNEVGLNVEQNKIALIVRAWQLYSEGKPITTKTLHLEYTTDEDGNQQLLELPTLGGIDLGDVVQADEEHIAAADPTPEDIEQAKTKLRAKRKAKKEQTPHETFTVSQAGSEWSVGDVGWVCEIGNDEPYLAKITDEPEQREDGVMEAMVVDESGGQWCIMLSDMHLEKPESKTVTTPKAKAASKGSTTAPVKHGKLQPPNGFQVGQLAWTADDNGDEPCQGRIVEINDKLRCAKFKVQNGFQGAGNVLTIPLKSLVLKQPGLVA